MLDNPLLLFFAVLIVVGLLWVAYKFYMANFWQKKRGSPVAAIPAAQRMDTRPVEYTILDAQQSTRRLGLLYAFTRRAKYFIMGGISILLALVYVFFPAGNFGQDIIRMMISVVILSGLAIGLSYWHSWAEQQQRSIARRIQWTEEQLLMSYGVITRQPVTGFYTRDFLIQMLETFLGQVGGESLPLACVMFEIRGLAAFEAQHGKDKATDVLKQVGKTLSRSARPYDLTGHDSDQRLILVLVRYPSRISVRDRFVAGTQQKVLDEINRQYKCNLELVWTRANLPDDAPTPLQLLSRARYALDHPEKASAPATA